MTLTELQTTITTPYFSTNQAQRLFAEDNPTYVNTQLQRMTQRGDLLRLKRGWYLFPHRQVDDLVLAGVLYEQSYVSLETALNTYGILPDIPAQISSVTPVTSKQIETQRGIFAYSKVQPELFFGYSQVQDQQSQLFYDLADVEKAVLDLIYLRQVKSVDEYRFDLSTINQDLLQEYKQFFPQWVQQVAEDLL